MSGVRVNIDLEKLTEIKLSRLKEIILSYKGSVPCHLIWKGLTGKVRLPLDENYKVNPVPQFAVKINEIFDQNNVKFIVDGELTSSLPT